jgi:mRNA-degrading endonuclease YafQ of YafQ-DinJ toxin-antitoxin module
MISMKVIATRSFRDAYKRLPAHVRKMVDNTIDLLASNPYHPSLQAHRLHQAKAEDVWSCYVSINKRLLYQYKDGNIYLWDVGEHSVIERVRQRRFL